MNGKLLLSYRVSFCISFHVLRTSFDCHFCSQSKLKTLCFVLVNLPFCGWIFIRIYIKIEIWNVENVENVVRLVTWRIMKSMKHEHKITSNIIIVHTNKTVKNKFNKHSKFKFKSVRIAIRTFHVERLSNTLFWALQIYQRLMIFIKRLTVFLSLSNHWYCWNRKRKRFVEKGIFEFVSFISFGIVYLLRCLALKNVHIYFEKSYYDLP